MRSEYPLVNIAAGFYQLFLYLYPAAFRHEFGEEMVVIFVDVSHDEQEKRGFDALVGLWVALFFDLIATAFIERIKEVFTMSMSGFGRLAGVGGIFAGVLWIAILIINALAGSNAEGILRWLAILPPAFMILVAMALFMQYEHNVSGILGLAAFVLGSILMVLSMVFSALKVDPDEGRAFTFIFLGYSIQGFGLLITGLAYRAKGYNKGWSTLLVPLGAFLIPFWPLMILIDNLIGFTDQFNDLVWSANWIVVGISWMVLGLIAYQGDREPADSTFRPA